MALEVESTYTMAGLENKSFGLAVGKRLSIQTSGTATVGRFSAGVLVESATVTSSTRIFGEYAVQMRFVVSADSYPVIVKTGSENGGSFTYDAIGNPTGLVDPAGNVITSRVHPYYFFHGYAGNQLAGDSVFYDMAVGNHGVRGADLTDAQMFANAGYVTTNAPSNPYDIAIRMPNLNFDYAGGEKLFIYWRGIAAGNGLGAESAILGDGWNTAASQRGVQIRTTTSGKVYLVLYGATAGVGLLSTSSVFDGSAPHDFAFLIDGKNKKYGMWVDGVFEPAWSNVYQTFGSGVSFDTKNSNTFNLGAAQAAPGVATQPQGGEATKVRCAAIIRLPASYTVPSVAKVTTAVNSLRAAPSKLLLAGSL